MKEIKDVELLPCPFCGSKGKIYNDPWGIGVHCKNNDCSADVRGSKLSSNRQHAARIWNQRVSK